MKLFYRYALLLLAICSPAISQTIFPGQSGQQLITSLVNAYKPSQVLSYTNARNFMFTDLNNFNGQVSCVYTEFTIALDPTVSEPIQVALAAGINTEHTWPQSLGATGNARADLHHLFPSRANVNSDRGNHPFDEIPDAATDRWYRLNQQQSGIPLQFIDEYSEFDFSFRFEPREDHKGNAARAIFYFYTMYAAQSDPNFFLQQKEVLRAWNSMDPVDAEELNRTQRIAPHQDGKPNPFVLDTTLIGRAFFGVTTGIAESGPPITPDGLRLMANYPNPFNPSTTISFALDEPMHITLTIYNTRGQRVRQLVNGWFPAGDHARTWDSADNRGKPVPSGLYLYQLQGDNTTQTRKMLLLR